jgi:hypothetical protein
MTSLALLFSGGLYVTNCSSRLDSDKGLAGNGATVSDGEQTLLGKLELGQDVGWRFF